METTITTSEQGQPEVDASISLTDRLGATYSDQAVMGYPIEADKFFGKRDWDRLRDLAGRVMPEGSVEALSRVKQARNRGGSGAGDLAAREYIDEFGAIDDDTLEEITALRDKAHHAEGAAIPDERYYVIERAAQMGLIESDPGKRLRHEQQDSKRAASSLLFKMTFHAADVIKYVQTPSAMLTQEQKDSVVERWQQEDAFMKARDEFMERYASLRTLKEKQDLLERYPEFASLMR